MIIPILIVRGVGEIIIKKSFRNQKKHPFGDIIILLVKAFIRGCFQ